MIYVKNDNKIITERVFVPNAELYSERKDNVLLNNFMGNSEFNNQYVVPSTFEELKNKLIRFEFDSYKLVSNIICSEDVLNDFDIILSSDLPINLKIKYIEKIDGMYKFSNFCQNVYPYFNLATTAIYKIAELKKALDICDEAGVYTDAANILSKENITTAENNGKVLKLVRKFNKFNEENKAFH